MLRRRAEGQTAWRSPLTEPSPLPCYGVCDCPQGLLCCGLVRAGKGHPREPSEAASEPLCWYQWQCSLQAEVTSVRLTSVHGCEGATRITSPPRGVIMQNKYYVARCEQPFFNALLTVQKQNTLSTNPHTQGATWPVQNIFISYKTQKCPLGRCGDSILKFSGFFPLCLKELHSSFPHFPVWVRMLKQVGPQMKTHGEGRY